MKTIEQLAEEYGKNNRHLSTKQHFLDGATAARSIYEAERAEMIGALKKIDQYFDTENDRHECEFSDILEVRMNIARAALSKVSEINDAKEGE